MAHYGSILHSAVRSLRQNFKHLWPEHVAMLDLSVLEHLDLLRLQSYPPIMVVLLIFGSDLNIFEDLFLFIFTYFLFLCRFFWISASFF